TTTAVAAVAKLRQAGEVSGRRAVVTASTGPVGMRAAGLLAKAGANTAVTSRRAEGGAAVADAIRRRFGAAVRPVTMADATQAAAVLEGAELLLNAGGAGGCLVPRGAWMRRAGPRAGAHGQAGPPPGDEGVEVTDNGVDRDGVIAFGALGIGGLKMNIHKACIERLFERNDFVLDAETIAEIAGSLM